MARPTKHRLPFMKRVPKGARVTCWDVKCDPMPPVPEPALDSDPGEQRARQRKLKDLNAER